MQANSAIITPVLAAGSTESPYYFQLNVSQSLCHAACASVTPVFNPQFSVLGWSSTATGDYVATIHIEGVISYVPCGADACCTKAQMLSQDFSIPFVSASAPTSITVTPGTPNNAVILSACQTCSRRFASEIPLTITIS